MQLTRVSIAVGQRGETKSLEAEDYGLATCCLHNSLGMRKFQGLFHAWIHSKHEKAPFEE